MQYNYISHPKEDICTKYKYFNGISISIVTLVAVFIIVAVSCLNHVNDNAMASGYDTDFHSSPDQVKMLRQLAKLGQ